MSIIHQPSQSGTFISGWQILLLWSLVFFVFFTDSILSNSLTVLIMNFILFLYRCSESSAAPQGAHHCFSSSSHSTSEARQGRCRCKEPRWRLRWRGRSTQLRKMASPFVPVPVPMDRALSGGSSKLRRPQRASSLGSVSSSSSCSSIIRVAGDDHGRGLGSQRQSRGIDRGSRSRTPPPGQSPVTRARVNGTLEPSVEYSSCPRSISDPVGSQQGEERPITPTVLGYEVMEERAKFTVWSQKIRFHDIMTTFCNLHGIWGPTLQLSDLT